jgi:general secretion pathway protein A
MYQAHFGLKRPLFDSGIAQDAAVFLAPKHERIVANCKVALTTFDSAVVVTGPAGVGKTTLISSALRATSTRLALGWITGAPAHGGELIELLLAEFGFNAHRAGRVERMQMWRQFLNEMSATESRVFVIAERADDLGHDVLRALDSLTAADANGCPGANLVLLGQPALLDQLKTPALESVRQRIRLRERLEPLARDELRDYLAHHVTRAGAELDKVFAPTAVDALHELSQGIPRVANNLCETALNLAAAGKETRLTPELLTRIAVAMFGIEPPAAPVASAATVAAAAPAKAAPAVPAAATASQPAPPSATARESIRASSPPADNAAPQAPIVSLTFASPASVQFAQNAPTYALPAAPDGHAAARAASAARGAPAISRDAPVLRPPPAPVPAPAPALAPAAVAARPAPATPPAPRTEPSPVVTRSSGASVFKPLQDRAVRPPPAATPATFPPVIESRASAPLTRPELEIDSFADTLTDTPDVQMPELPVLTDAVEPAIPVERPRARAETAYARHSPPPARSPIVTPPATAPAPPNARSAPAKPAPPPPVAQTQPRSLDVAEEDLVHQTQTVRALAAAKSIDDISNSMAETLFGEADIDMLSAALASAGWSKDGTPPETAPQKPAPKPEPAKATAPAPQSKPKPTIEEDPFDLFGLGPDAPLELIDDSTPPDDHGHKAASNR